MKKLSSVGAGNIHVYIKEHFHDPQRVSAGRSDNVVAFSKWIHIFYNIWSLPQLSFQIFYDLA